MRPPTFLNITISLIAYSVALGSLYVTAHAQDVWVKVIAVIVFSYVGNTIFSLLHESVHRAFSRNRRVNDLFGLFSAAFFPTGYTFQRLCHLSHHRNNRTDVEMFDMYYSTDNLFLKRLQWYFVLTGVYWTNPPTGALLYLFWPSLLKSKLLRGASPDIQHLGADAMLSSFDRNVPEFRIRAEILFSLIFQIAVFVVLGLTWWSWLACYWAFGMNWGGLQYADHAWSKRDIRNGAWNLRVNRLMQYVFLNYHHHLAHHQHPNVPWIYLSRLVDFSAVRPTFIQMYLRMWRGPRPVLEKQPGQLDLDFQRLLYEGEN